MWRLAVLLTALTAALLPIAAAASPDDRGGGLAVAPQVTIARQEQEVSALRAQLLSVTTERDQLQGRVDTLQGQVDALQVQLARVGVGAGGAGAITLSGPARANLFAFGNCTWYVFNRWAAAGRYIPWMGNAIQWWPNAAAAGFAEGQVPRVGAIMVSAESGWGHVAVVEAVGSGGLFTVSEMNWAGFDVIDWRVVDRSRVPVIGFIY